jgi:hypothetical protein
MTVQQQHQRHQQHQLQQQRQQQRPSVRRLAQRPKQLPQPRRPLAQRQQRPRVKMLLRESRRLPLLRRLLLDPTTQGTATKTYMSGRPWRPSAPKGHAVPRERASRTSPGPIAGGGLGAGRWPRSLASLGTEGTADLKPAAMKLDYEDVVDLNTEITSRLMNMDVPLDVMVVGRMRAVARWGTEGAFPWSFPMAPPVP